MFVTTLNFFPNCQITGVVISFGGYVSQRRVAWDFPGLRPVLANVAGLDFCAGFFKWVVEPGLSARDGWNDADLIPIFQRSLLILEETDIFLVYVNIDEAANCPILIDQALFYPGIPRLQFSNGISHSFCDDLHYFLIVGQLP